jgi:hypothetical protein
MGREAGRKAEDLELRGDERGRGGGREERGERRDVG